MTNPITDPRRSSPRLAGHSFDREWFQGAGSPDLTRAPAPESRSHSSPYYFYLRPEASPATPAPVAAAPIPASNGKSGKAWIIMTEESDLSVVDVTVATVFSDSVVGLTISVRFEEYDMDLDFHALFYEHPSVGELRLSMEFRPHGRECLVFTRQF